ncbi:MAG TPA: cysteine--tRNA ligase [Anaerolineae bacterium]|nr:cysteine--tRNA ligase [Anaerolineae bacterium]
MALTVYNFLTRRREEFKPIHEGFVGLYVCGPTVYGHSHIGHAKIYVSFDVMVRYLRHLGYRVRYVRNITDVGHLTDDADEGEDKILRRARQERSEPMELVETYMHSFFEDMDALNVLRPDISPRATCHIPEQVGLVQTLLERGHAYESGGSVYFDVSSWPEYGKLSGRKVEEQEEGARVAVNPEKQDPADFAVWKKAEPSHILRWPSPWGWGYPGWHLECSVMATKYLGQPFDIHGGGLENVFPHNESEIAQIEAATEERFCNYWLLNNMVTVDGVKMGKSLGNFVTIKDALSRHDPMTIRFFILSSHYRSPTDFSEEALDAAGRGLERLLGAVGLVRERLRDAREGEPDAAWAAKLDEYRGRVVEAMDDDFGTPQAIAALFDLGRDVNALLYSGEPVSRGTLEAIDAFYRELGGEVLGIIPDDLARQAGGEMVDTLLRLLIDLRQQARQNRNWAEADAIRDRLLEMGVTLEDSAEGTRWRLAR